MKIKDIKSSSLNNNPVIKNIKHNKDFQHLDHLDATYIDHSDPDLTDEEKNPSVRAGYYSHVKPHPNPHMINKINTAEDNAYNFFVQFLINNKQIKDNIHFPRIHEIKKFTKNEKHTVIQYVMEKLHKTLHDYIYEDFNNLEMLAEMYLDDNIAQKYTELRDDKNKMLRLNKDSLPYTFAQDVLNPKNVKLESFKQALSVLQPFLKKSVKLGYVIDLHANNLMVRLTSVGPQIVIIDPLSNNEENEDEWV